MRITLWSLLIIWLCFSSARAQNIRQDSLRSKRHLSKGMKFSKSFEQDSALKWLSLAHKDFKRQVKTHPENGPWRAFIVATNSYASSLRTASAFTQATELIDSSIFLVEQRFDSSYFPKASLYNQLGITYKQLGKWKESVTAFELGLSIINQYPSSRSLLKSSVLQNLATVYRQLGKLKEAEELLYEAIAFEEAGEIKDSLEYSKIFGNLGIILASQDRLEEANGCFQKELFIKEQVLEDNDPGIAIVLTNIGRSYKELGDYITALDHYQMALRIFRNAYGELHTNIAAVYNNIGSTYLLEGDSQQALLYYFKALDMRNTLFNGAHPSLVQSHNNLYAVFASLKKYEEAEYHIEEAHRIAKESLPPKHHFTASTLLNKGALYTRQAKFSKAVASMKEGLEMEKAVLPPNHPFLGRAYQMLGETYLRADMDQQANRQFLQALPILEKAYTNHHHLAVAYHGMGVVQNKKKNYQQAESFFQKALNANTLPKDHPLSKDFTQLNTGIINEELYLSILESKGSNLIDEKGREGSLEADAIFKQGILLIDKLRNSYLGDKSQLKLMDRAWGLYEHGIINSLALYEQTGEESYLNQAFNWMERSKATQLSIALQDQQARRFSGVPEELLAMESQIRKKVVFYESKLAGIKPKTDSIKAITYRDKLFQVKRSYDSLLYVLEVKHPQYFNLKYQTPSISLKEFQQNLNDSSLVVNYFWGEERMICIGIYADGVSYFNSPIDSSFIQKIDNFRTFIYQAEVPSDLARLPDINQRFISSSYQLYSELLEQLEPVIFRKSALKIIPDGPLAYLPFELFLPSELASPKAFNEMMYLIRSHTIHYNYSSNLLSAKSAGRKSWKNQYLGIAPSYSSEGSLFASSRDAELYKNLHPEFINLLYNQPEVSVAASIMNGRELKGAKATEEAFKSMASQSRVLHLAMHAFTNDEAPIYSGLVFYPESTATTDTINSVESSYFEENDGFLHAYEIFNMDLDSELAVLSACQTGIGIPARGEGMKSLAWAFQYAGCPSIITSLWKADDGATKTIMEDFFRNLKSGLSKDQALRYAKLSYLDQADPLQAHPSQWATFILIGNNQPLKTQFPLIYTIMGILLVLVLLILTSRYFSRRNKSQKSLS